MTLKPFIALLALAAPLAAQTPKPAAAKDTLIWPTGTFSIVAMDPATGEMGVAVQSRVFSVGNGVIWGEAGVGVVATQAVVDVSYGPQALALLRKGLSAEEVVKQVLAADPDPDSVNWSKKGRQFAVLDTNGHAVPYTGPGAPDSAGDKTCTAPNICSAQGNTLAHPAVADSMVAWFERTPGRLAVRLVAALEGGQSAGGDKRGMQSAALLIVNKKHNCGIWLHNDVELRLQVDDSPTPIAELKRLVNRPEAMRKSRGC